MAKLVEIQTDSRPISAYPCRPVAGRGGGTSHAAVTIPQLNKIGVVGFNKLHVYESEGYSVVDGKTIKEGDYIGIDGWSGAVYTGKHEIDLEESYKISI